MAEKNNLEILSSMMGDQGKDVLQMFERMERLKKLVGPLKVSAPMIASNGQEELFSRSRNENMISAAIPFLDQAYQKEMYVMVRFMEMRRVLQSAFLEVREKQQEPLPRRRQKLLQAVQPYLNETEQERMEMIRKWMMMQDLMGRSEQK